MCIRFCFGSWELENSTQYSVLSTQTEPSRCLVRTQNTVSTRTEYRVLGTEYCISCRFC